MRDRRVPRCRARSGGLARQMGGPDRAPRAARRPRPRLGLTTRAAPRTGRATGPADCFTQAMDIVTLRAWWAHRQGLDGSLAGAKPAEVLSRAGWARSVG